MGASMMNSESRTQKAEDQKKQRALEHHRWQLILVNWTKQKQKESFYMLWIWSNCFLIHWAFRDWFCGNGEWRTQTQNQGGIGGNIVLTLTKRVEKGKKEVGGDHNHLIIHPWVKRVSSRLPYFNILFKLTLLDRFYLIFYPEKNLKVTLLKHY